MEYNALAPVAGVTPGLANDANHEPGEITFPQGLVGCPDWRRFVLSPDPIETCGALVSLDQPGVALIIAEPTWLGINYHFELAEDDEDALQLRTAEDARIYCILTLNRTPPLITANLAGPLVINGPARLGHQVILDHLAYPLRAPVIAGEAAREVLEALTDAMRDHTDSANPPSAPPATVPQKGA